MLEYREVIGVDEVGRGPLFGEVVAAAVYIKDSNLEIFNQINDSKKLTEKKREKIYSELINNPNIIYSVGIADEKEIDEVNILNATFLAMRRALEKLEKLLKKDGINLKEKLVLVDGNKLIREYDGKQEFLIKGDSKDLSIATASIIAKVTRDNMMLEYDKIYPEYSLKNHKGYPTKKHYEAIEKYGILDKHRKSFLKKILNDIK